ncbi:hypothetical protein ACTWLT_11210 [Micromonospora sp. ZYX-F-536]
MEHDLDALAAGVADHVDFAHFAYAVAADVAEMLLVAREYE